MADRHDPGLSGGNLFQLEGEVHRDVGINDARPVIIRVINGSACRKCFCIALSMDSVSL